jgi:hypothetical protein
LLSPDAQRVGVAKELEQFDPARALIVLTLPGGRVRFTPAG